MKSPMSRRTLLRGAGGVAIALPMLEAMGPRSAFAQAPKGAPKRLLTFLNENGVVPSAWFPAGGATEKNFEMGPLLKSWTDKGLKANTIMLDGLDNKASGGTCHAAARCGTLTGANNGGGRANHASIDQAVAAHIGGTTRFKSLETSVFLRNNFIYGLFFSGPGQMVQPLDAPEAVFTKLFTDGLPMTGGGSMPDPLRMQELEALRLRKKSILDRTMDEFKRVSSSLGPGDQMRLGRHMEGIREIERRLDNAGSGGGGPSQACKLPDKPAPMADFRVHTELQSKLVTMALACDLTRVASIQTRASLTNFTWLGVNTGQHALSHQQGSAGADAQLNKIQAWFAEQVAALIDMLKGVTDSDGQTLFDNTLLFWANDLGRGTHSRQRYPFMLATGKFTLPDGKILETGRYLKAPNGTAHNELLVAIGRMMGMNITKFGGYGNGPLSGLGV